MDLADRMGGVDWIGMGQDRDKWRALVNVVMNFWNLYNAGKLSSGYATDGLLSGAPLVSCTIIKLMCFTPACNWKTNVKTKIL
jgi:hypothetical protein